MIEAPVIFEAAHRYVERGFSILPCTGKQPSILKWEALQERPPTPADVNRWRDMGILRNVGIVCGAVSGNLVVIDLDGEEAISRFSAEFPSLMETYTVQSGSGHGAHLYLRAELLPETKRTVNLEWGNVEMRANGHYVVAPPSIHPDTGQRYVVSSRVPIKHVMSLTLLGNWIQAQNDSKRPPTQRSTEKPAIRGVGNWALAALDAECADVRTAPAGSRNHTLNRAAFKLGQLVGAGKLSREKVEKALEDAAQALAQQDGEHTVNRTIQSGLSAGIKNPRT